MRQTDVVELLDHWRANGLISVEQAQRMRADLPEAQPRAPLVVEGMDYLGGALVFAALGLFTGWYWADLSLGGRLAVVVGATLALAAAGSAVPRARSASSTRLRALLWLGSTAGLFGVLTLLGIDAFRWHGDATVTFAAAGAALGAASFWSANRHPVQHIAFYLLLLTLTGSAVAQLPHPGMLPAVAVWALGMVWGLLAWGDLVRPNRLASILAALAALGGAAAVAGERWGSILAVGTAAALIVVAVGMRDIVLLVVASAGTLVILPTVVTHYFPGALGAALALLIVGLLLVGAAVVMARRRRTPLHQIAEAAHDWTRGPVRTAVAAAITVLVVATACVLLAGT